MESRSCCGQVVAKSKKERHHYGQEDSEYPYVGFHVVLGVGRTVIRTGRNLLPGRPRTRLEVGCHGEV